MSSWVLQYVIIALLRIRKKRVFFKIPEWHTLLLVLSAIGSYSATREVLSPVIAMALSIISRQSIKICMAGDKDFERKEREYREIWRAWRLTYAKKDRQRKSMTDLWVFQCNLFSSWSSCILYKSDTVSRPQLWNLTKNHIVIIEIPLRFKWSQNHGFLLAAMLNMTSQLTM